MNRTLAIASLERALQLNRAAKLKVPDCPCWANAPQEVDAELYKVLEPSAADEEQRFHALSEAIRRHQRAKQEIPECTCWSTPTRKADLDLYQALAGIQA